MELAGTLPRSPEPQRRKRADLGPDAGKPLRDPQGIGGHRSDPLAL